MKIYYQAVASYNPPDIDAIDRFDQWIIDTAETDWSYAEGSAIREIGFDAATEAEALVIQARLENAGITAETRRYSY
jgi:hypothetical protein